ncbi:MAG: hypothetical protein ABI042_04750 [Verrucomicrobiota bacterium]
MKSKPQFHTPLKILSFGRNESLICLNDGTKWMINDSARAEIAGHWLVGDDVFLWPENQDIQTTMLVNITRYNFVDEDAVAVMIVR